MKKVANQTARVLWQMGQALLPEHFYAQEQSLREELALRLRLLSGPGWGLGSLSWDGFQLLKGIVSIQEMSLVMSSGTLVDVPGNTAPAFVNLSAAGARASVYVHLQSGFEQVHAAGRGAAGEDSVERLVHKIELSTNPFVEGAAQSFKLAELDRGPDGVWSVRSDYVPPLLLVGTSPFFDPYVARMLGIVRALRQTLLTEVQENYLAASGNTAGRIALRGLFALQARLVDLHGGVHLHPYELYCALRDLHIDVCVHRDVLPSHIDKPYQHDDIAGCFSVLLEHLEEQAQVKSNSIPYVELTRSEGLLVGDIPKEAKRAKDVFLLVQKPQASTRVDLSRVKLASLSRINLVYERSLRGIPYQLIENPPFQHGLSSTVEFYAISPGQEWDYAVREGKLVLFDSPGLQSARFYLYWRAD